MDGRNFGIFGRIRSKITGKKTMRVDITRAENGITIVSLAGRLDLEGARDLESTYTFETTTGRALIVVNLAAVSFLASIGIRTLLVSARAQGQRGGKLVLAGADPLVRKVIETAGVDQLIPTFATVGLAEAALLNG